MWGCILYLVNQLLMFPLNNEHDDAPDALEGAVQLARASEQVGAGIEECGSLPFIIPTDSENHVVVRDQQFWIVFVHHLAA